MPPQPIDPQRLDPRRREPETLDNQPLGSRLLDARVSRPVDGGSVEPTADPSVERLGDIGEDELLRRIFPLMPPEPRALLGPGDDAAVLGLSYGSVVLTTDTMVLDCFVFPGNSGGPVVLRPERTTIEGTASPQRALLLGVVKSYVPYQDVAISRQTGRPRVVFEENTGLCSAHPIDVVADLARRHAG